MRKGEEIRAEKRNIEKFKCADEAKQKRTDENIKTTQKKRKKPLLKNRQNGIKKKHDLKIK